MAGINWDSIMKKAAARMEDRSMQSAVSEKIDEIALGKADVMKGLKRPVHSVEEAADKFAGVLHMTILSSGLHPHVEERLANLEYGKPFKIGDRTYQIAVWFEEDLTRETMSTLKDYYPVDLAELYNDGVDHVMRQLFEWRDTGGVKVLLTSNQVIPATHFMEQAIRDFMGNYGSEYNVQDITIRRDRE